MSATKGVSLSVPIPSHIETLPMVHPFLGEVCWKMEYTQQWWHFFGLEFVPTFSGNHNVIVLVIYHIIIPSFRIPINPDKLFVLGYIPNQLAMFQNIPAILYNPIQLPQHVIIIARHIDKTSICNMLMMGYCYIFNGVPTLYPPVNQHSYAIWNIYILFTYQDAYFS